jgi:hypothetical protein
MNNEQESNSQSNLLLAAEDNLEDELLHLKRSIDAYIGMLDPNDHSHIHAYRKMNADKMKLCIGFMISGMYSIRAAEYRNDDARK